MKLIDSEVEARADELYTRLSKTVGVQCATVKLLSVIAVELDDIRAALELGQNTRISPVTLETAAKVILAKDTSGRRRKVKIFIDKAPTGAPIPTVRIGENLSDSASGGPSLSPGQMYDLGSIGPEVALYGAASAAIGAHLLVEL